MKKESSTNSRKCLGQKNLDTSNFEIPEISLAQLILEQFTVNKETYKILLDIIYGDKGRENGISTMIRQLRDYVILDRKDYEKLVQNSSPEKFNESALEARDASIKLLEQQLAHQEDWANYWKNKYEKCLEELKKETTRWWRF